MLINFIQELNIFTLYYIFYIPLTILYLFLVIPYYFLSLGKFIILIITFFTPYIINFVEITGDIESRIEKSSFQNTNLEKSTREMTSSILNRTNQYLLDLKNYCGKKSKENQQNNKKIINLLIIVISSCFGILIILNIVYYLLYPNIYRRAIRFNNYYIEFVRILICIIMFILFNFSFSTSSMIPLFKEIITSESIKRFNRGAT